MAPNTQVFSGIQAPPPPDPFATSNAGNLAATSNAGPVDPFNSIPPAAPSSDMLTPDFGLGGGGLAQQKHAPQQQEIPDPMGHPAGGPHWNRRRCMKMRFRHGS